MKYLLFIFLGGGLGSVLRFLISSYTQKWWKINTFPFGTFLVNVLGCFLIGYLSSYLKVDHHRFLFITGFCGAFTTFSTFSLESFQLYQQGEILILLSYIILSIIIGLIAIYWGLHIIE